MTTECQKSYLGRLIDNAAAAGDIVQGPSPEFFPDITKVAKKNLN